MQKTCQFCGNHISPERVALGLPSCVGCAEKYTPSMVVVPMGVAIVSRSPQTVAPRTEVKPPEVTGRFVVLVGGRPVEGFDSLPKAILAATQYDTPQVRDRIPPKEGGLGQVYPTPDRVGRTHHNRWSRY